jgi:hypothetical protein
MPLIADMNDPFAELQLPESRVLIVITGKIPPPNS